MRRLLMTGSGSSLGQGIASTFLAAGWQVLALGKDSPAEISHHPQFRFSPLDFQQRPQYRQALTHLLQEGQPDLVLLNAGVLLPEQEFHHVSLEELDHAFQTNLWAHRLILDLLLQLTPGIPQVIALNSRSLTNGHHGWGAYALSKSGLNMLMRLYAAEHPQVHFCALAPGNKNHAVQADALSPHAIAQEVLRLLPELPKAPSGCFVEINPAPRNEPATP